MERFTARRIEAVIKVTERCNINCTYCYVFNKGNEDFRNRPVYLKPSVITEITDYLRQGMQELQAEQASVVFHGGEPLMLKRTDFDIFCSELRRHIPKLTLGVQTNAMLVDDAWIELFHKHQVHVGVSIDGDKPIHDQFRIDHRGRGTYDRVLTGIRRLQAAAAQQYIPEPGAICVINPEADGAATYRHFVDALGFRSLSFHLPMDTYETFGDADVTPYARFLNDAFDQWVMDDDPGIYIRMFDQLLRFYHGKASSVLPSNGQQLSMQHVTISTDGTIGIDELKPAPIPQDGFDVRTSTLHDFAGSDLARYMRDVYRSLPAGCTDCPWKNYCGGGIQHGVQVNRWSNSSGFDNASLLCNALKDVYEHVASYAVRNGLAVDALERALTNPSITFLPSASLGMPPGLPTPSAIQ